MLRKGTTRLGLTAFLAAVVVLGLLPGAAVSSRSAWGATSQVDPAVAARAGKAYAAMRRRFALGGGRYSASDAHLSLAHLWPLSQALSASLAFGGLPGRRAAAARADALRTIGQLPQYRLGLGYESLPLSERVANGNLYYDDNNWIALDLLDVYQLTGKKALLRRAEGVFRFLASGWDANAGDPCPGGVFWARPPLRQIRTTVSTANAALVALQLYQVTGKASYLDWGRRMYEWVQQCLAAPDGLYYDHVDSLGNVSTQEWSYNQGAMVAAGVLLAQATGQSAYLKQARATATAALARYGRSGFKREPPIFVAIFFGDLNLVRRTLQLPSYQAALRHYLHRHVRLRADGHFGSSLVFQAAAVQLYSFAAVSG